MLEVREVSPGDEQQVLLLRQEALTEHPLAFSSSPEDDRMNSQSYQQHITSDDMALFGIFAEEVVVGMAGLMRNSSLKTRHSAYIWGAYLRSSYRGRGAGRQLMELLIERARSWGCESVDLGVSSSAPEARQLYLSLGFVPIGLRERAILWQGTAADEEYMVLQLP
ncbi:MAG: GNAT family N-acetyltransferase [Planctomycetota bacterium]|nr:GNAT family N-acetyltransferase [Planctomycetota bacterium]